MTHNFSLTLFGVLLAIPLAVQQPSNAADLLSTETIDRESVWVMPAAEKIGRQGGRVTVWFEEQLLGDGKAYQRRSKEWSGRQRRELRTAAIATLKELSQRSNGNAAASLKTLVDDGVIVDLDPHWIINGFSCTVRGKEGIEALSKVPGVKSIFLSRGGGLGQGRRATPAAKFFPAKAGDEEPAFDPSEYKHPWYSRQLLADRVWSEFGVDGAGVLNIVQDGNFVLNAKNASTLYRNPDEIPGNGKDDDGNGLVDDYHGYNFATRSAQTSMFPRNAPLGIAQLHGTMCAAVICGRGSAKVPVELGIAPRSQWAGVIAGPHVESAVEWAIERGADTYSMSFSMPGLGEYRSHMRKVMEHGAICGVCFVSGAGNFAQKGSRSFAPVPVQMRTPEDIPDVVFAAAGVQRNLTRTVFSSQGPVEWNLEHYQDGQVQKPEVCAFNHQLPAVFPNGSIHPTAISGNSFAGPMFCGSIALMLSADPDLLPWDLKEIITTTALDVGPEGVDFQTGHGLINCYRAVKEVLRRRAVREGKDDSKYRGRSEGDELDVAELKKRLAKRQLQVLQVRPNSAAAKAGVQAGDVLTKVDGKDVSTQPEFVAAMRAAYGGGKTEVKIEVTRGKKEISAMLPRAQPSLGVGDVYLDPVFQ